MLGEEAEKDEKIYLELYNEFQFFLKEGLATEPENQDALLPLIRYESNYTDKFVNIDDYLKQMTAGQENIYFILAPTRDLALNSAYMEPFKNTKVPVLIVNMHVDEMVYFYFKNC
jgi:HSP90 family molecular chaperone